MPQLTKQHNQQLMLVLKLTVALNQILRFYGLKLLVNGQQIMVMVQYSLQLIQQNLMLMQLLLLQI
jgi:hypothetical protein